MFCVIALWLGVLFIAIGIVASDFFCINLSTIASFCGLSESVAGATFLAFGNGSPDIFTAFVAMKTGSGSLAIAGLVGGASFVIAIVAGSLALVTPFKVARKSFVRDVCFCIIVMSFLMYSTHGGRLHIGKAKAIAGLYVLYVIVISIWAWHFASRRKRRLELDHQQAAYETSSVQDLASPNSEAGRFQAYSVNDDDHYDQNQESAALENDPVIFPENLASVEQSLGMENLELDSESEEEERMRDSGEIDEDLPFTGNARKRQMVRETIKAPARPNVADAVKFQSALSRLNEVRMNSFEIPPVESHGPNDVGLAPLSEHQMTVGTNAFSSSVAAPPSHPQARQKARAARRSPPRILSQPKQEGRATSSSPPPMSRQAKQKGGATHLSPPPTPTQSSSVRALATSTVSRNDQTSDLPSDENASGSPKARPLPPQLRIAPEDSAFQKTSDNSHVLVRDTALSIQSSPPTLSPLDLGPDAPEHRYPRASMWTRLVRWWPDSLLPPPEEISSMLFPTLSSWEDKTITSRFFAITSAPFIFLFAITLPVTEPEIDRDDMDGPDFAVPSPLSTSSDPKTFKPGLELAQPTPRLSPSPSSPTESTASPDSLENRSVSPTSEPRSSGGWNRWLVCLQASAAPFFIIFIAWLNDVDMREEASVRLPPAAVSALCSAGILCFLVATTDPTRPPRWRHSLALLGCLVSGAWIFAVATEIVHAIRSLSVILNISETIFGLTLIAVGNSLGDLIADITVARLGYPVMALSACLGGPMLNLSLGVGGSMVYLTLSGRSMPNEILIPNSVRISMTTVLVSLIWLLVLVPWRGWRMDKLVGSGLFVLWTINFLWYLVLEIRETGG